MAKSSKRKKKKQTGYWIVLLLLGLFIIAAIWPGKKMVEDKMYPLKYNEEVTQWAEEFAVDPYLVFSVIKTESGFDPLARSNADAIGLMQMTEDTFDWIKGKIAPSEPLVFEDLLKPEVSIRFGTYFLAISLERYQGDISTAAAAYHSGWGTVDRLLEEGEHTENGIYLHSFPYAQMSHYVNKVNKNHAEYLRIYTKQK